MAIQNQQQQQQQQQQQHHKLQQENQTETAPTPVAFPGLISLATTTTTSTNTTAAAAAAAPTTNGPRVSFNRDVHVKRIGKRPNENTIFLLETTNLQSPNTHHLRRELPDNLSAESIRKEAALVIAQAERLTSKAAKNTDNIPLIIKGASKKYDNNSPNKFHSLPSRKKRAPTKPVTRSISDAAAVPKKFKRPSIFNIFNRKSETANNQIEREQSHSGGGSTVGRRTLGRSKSDAGSYKEQRNAKQQQQQQQQKKSKDDTTTFASFVNASGSTKQSSYQQLSPIIENTQKEDFFEEQFNRERRKSADATTESENATTNLEEFHESKSPQKVSGNIGYTHHDDLDFIPAKPISETIKETITTLQAHQSHLKSTDEMHSSQLPIERPPLTKGLTVNGMVKRLSMERFSPPPTITSPAFSYIRPNEGIIYAQLANEDDLRSPRQVQTPAAKQPVRNSAVTSADTLSGYSTSHRNQNQNVRTSYSSGNRITIESPMRDEKDSPFSPVSGPTKIRIEKSASPSPWQQLSPRNLSDEDEGLGIETRKYFEEEPTIHKLKQHKYQHESPIGSVVGPTLQNGNEYRDSKNIYLLRSKEHDPITDLGQRRAQLESRILTRCFSSSDTNERQFYPNANRSPPGQTQTIRQEAVHESSSDRRYISSNLNEPNPRFHKLQSAEILNRYSPERSHLDMIAPSTKLGSMAVPRREEKTSRYVHTRYYDDGTGGVKEVYKRETRMDENGQPCVHESRRRERLDSLKDMREQSPAIEKHQLPDYEPKSFDSQFTGTEMYRSSSPENNLKLREGSGGSGGGGVGATQQTIMFEDNNNWQSSLKRDKRQQRSFDKGDSGIENDFRKESFNGDINNRWRKRTPQDDMKASELFIKKERRHSEQLHPGRKKLEYVYRERSIDDGSHFDPRLDKYPTSTNSLRRVNTSTQVDIDSKDTLKRTKKLGGFEKVKQLFSGSGNGRKKENDANKANAVRSESPPSSQMFKDKYMVKEEEMRSRYHEYRGGHQSNLREAKAMDISMRRRLSTPKASPLLLKRTSSEKTHKKSPLSQKSSTPEMKPEKTSWFKSLDRKSKSKSKEKEPTINEENDTINVKHKTYRESPSPSSIPSKNLRFFGDTDLESNSPNISKVTSTARLKAPVSMLNRSQKYSQSAYHLDQIEHGPSVSAYLPPSDSMAAVSGRSRSTSLHNLDNDGLDETDFRKRRHYSRSRNNLDDISESGSESEDKPKRQTSTTASRSISRERLDRLHRYDDHAYRKSSDSYTMERTANNNIRKSDASLEYHPSATSTLRKQMPHHMLGPPKPARSADRRLLSSYSRERDRLPADSSGTEGESSLHSQRSVVYLHATTVGAIPQPYHLSSRRRSISRDDIRGKGKQSQPMQPMTRSVSRSVSMLAPWKPKFVSDGYEINYSQEQNERTKKTSTLPRKHHLSGSTSSINRNVKKSLGDAPSSSRSRRNQLKKEDQLSTRNSSSTSASKSGISTSFRNGNEIESSRRRVK